MSYPHEFHENRNTKTSSAFAIGMVILAISVFFFILIGLVGLVLFLLFSGRVSDDFVPSPGQDIPEPWLQRTEVHVQEPGGLTVGKHFTYKYFPEELPDEGEEFQNILQRKRFLIQDVHRNEYLFGLATCLAHVRRYKEAETTLKDIVNADRKNQAQMVCGEQAVQHDDFTDAERFADALTDEDSRNGLYDTIIKTANAQNALDDTTLERIASKLSNTAQLQNATVILLERGKVESALEVYRKRRDLIDARPNDDFSVAGIWDEQNRFVNERILPALLEKGEFEKAVEISKEFSPLPQRSTDENEQGYGDTIHENRLCTIIKAQLQAGEKDAVFANIRLLKERNSIREVFAPLIEHGYHLEAIALAQGRLEYNLVLDHVLKVATPEIAMDTYKALPEGVSENLRNELLHRMRHNKAFEELFFDELYEKDKNYAKMVEKLLKDDQFDEALSMAEGISILDEDDRGRYADSTKRRETFEVIVKYLHEKRQYEKAREVIWKMPISWDAFLDESAVDGKSTREQLAAIRSLDREVNSLLSSFYTQRMENVALSKLEPSQEELRRMTELVVPNDDFFIFLLKAKEKAFADQWLTIHKTRFGKKPLSSALFQRMIKEGLFEETLQYSRESGLNTNELLRILLEQNHREHAISVAKDIPIIQTYANGKGGVDTLPRTKAFELISKTLQNQKKPDQAREAILQYPLSWEQVLEKEPAGLAEIAEGEKRLRQLGSNVRNMHIKTLRMLSEIAQKTKTPLTESELRQLLALGTPDFKFFELLYRHDEKLGFAWIEKYRSYYDDEKMNEMILVFLFDEGRIEDALRLCETAAHSVVIIGKFMEKGDFDEAVRLAEKVGVETTDPQTGEKRYDASLRTRAFEKIFNYHALRPSVPPVSYETILHYPISWEKVLGKKDFEAEDVRDFIRTHPEHAAAVRYTQDRTGLMMQTLAQRTDSSIPEESMKAMAELGTNDLRLFKTLLESGQLETARIMAERQKEWYGNEFFEKQLKGRQ